MGRIVCSVVVSNTQDPAKSLRCDALVDTGASHLVLPSAWKTRLGDLRKIETVELETANQSSISGEVYGPVEIQMEGFRPIFNEVIFIDMNPHDGTYDPLIGYIVLEQSQAAVDRVSHRLRHVKRLDLKCGVFL